jgi:putative permease
MKKLAAYALVVLITLCAIYLLYVFRAVVILFFLSLFVASAARPVIRRLTERGWSLALAILVTYLIGIIVVAGWVFLVGYFVIPEGRDLLDMLANRYQTLQQSWQGGGPLQQSLAERLPPPQQLLDDLVAEEGTLLAQLLVTIIGTTASVLAALVVMLILSIYWSIDRVRFEGLWLSIIPVQQRGRARLVWRSVEENVGNYLRVQGTQLFLAVILLAGGYYVMGIEYPVLLALVGALAWLIPVVGYIFAAVAALLVGLAYSPLVGGLAAVYTGVIFVALHELVERTIMKYEHNFSYLLVVLLMIPLADTYGFFGLLAAPPLAASIDSLLTMLFESRRTMLTADDPEARITELHERLQTLQDQAAAEDGSLSPDIASLMGRLDKLLVRTQVLVESEKPVGSLPSGDP